MKQAAHKISFIIPAWDEEELIGKTIELINDGALALGMQYEIIVADDASEDRTASIAASLGATVISCHHRQIAATRNSGAGAATGSWLVFVDADTLVSKRVIEETMEAFQNGAVSGTSFPCFEGELPFLAKILTPTIRLLFRILRLAAGAYLFCTKEAFDAIGGFDEKYFAAEEAHLSWALHRQGKFMTLQSRVVTSGRKFRSHSSIHILTTLLLVSIPGIRSIKKRKDLWYGSRTQNENKSCNHWRSS